MMQSKSEAMWLAYLLIFPDSMHYVGITNGTIESRIQKGYPNNAELSAALEKYGGWQNVKIFILRRDVPDCEIDEVEQFYIKQYDSQWPNGYNKDSGGRKGFHRCQATKDKISAALRNHPATSSPVLQIHMKTGEVLADYPSIAEAERVTEISGGDISLAVRGLRSQAGGYVWLLISDFEAAGEIPAVVSINGGKNNERNSRDSI